MVPGDAIPGGVPDGSSLRTFILGIPDRYRGMSLEADLRERGVPFQRIDASDAATWTSADLKPVYDSVASRIQMYRDLTPAEIACALGHRDFMARLADSDADWGILLEDDTRVIGDFADLIPLLRGMSARRVIVLLGGSTFPAPEPVCTLGAGALGAVRLGRPPFGAWAYAMSRTAARAAIRAEQGRRVSSTADWPLAWGPATEFWRLTTPLAIHPPGDAGSLLNERRAASLRSIGQRRPGRRLVVSGLRLSGVLALVGRMHGLPFWRLWVRDWQAFRRRVRGRLQKMVSPG